MASNLLDIAYQYSPVSIINYIILFTEIFFLQFPFCKWAYGN